MVTITRLSNFALILVLIAGLCGCDLVANILLAPDGGENIVDESIPMTIGMVAPLTGKYAGPYGLPMERGFLLARDEINEFEAAPVRIELITEDNMSTTEGSIAAYKRLIDAGVPAIVGLAISTHAQQAFPVAQENQVVAFSPVSSAAGLSGIGDYIFRAALAVDRLNPAGVRSTHALLGYERAALIYDDADVYSTSSNQYIATTLEELGVEVTTVQAFQTGDTDFAAQLTEIMALNPDAVFISALSTEVVRIMTQGREIGIAARYITPLLGDSEAKMAGEAAEGAVTFRNWSSTLDNPINRDFVEGYRSTYGIEPDTWAAQSYATLFILYFAILEALAQSNDSIAPDAMAIRDALAMTRDFDTNMGPFSFDPNGDAIHDEVVLVVKDGKLVLLEDADIPQAVATIGPTSGSRVTGTATFTQVGNYITLLVEIEDASPGLHAVHIHQYGDCSSPDGKSAGGHWNPTGVAHGKWGEGEFHLGDIGNINVGEDGTGSISLTTDLWEIGTGGDVDIVGRGIIVHAGADDFTSQPSGAAGARIGCGVIELAAQP